MKLTGLSRMLLGLMFLGAPGVSAQPALGPGPGPLVAPDTVTVSSDGATSGLYGEFMGVYTKTPHIVSGRPVWQSTVRADISLYYDGNNLNRFS